MTGGIAFLSEDAVVAEKEIYARLGLEDPDVHALAQMRRNLSEEAVARLGVRTTVASARRRTGRTTRTLVRALAHLSIEPACIVFLEGASASETARLLRQARDYARALGIDEARLRSGLPIGVREAVVYRDHFDRDGEEA